MRQVLLRVIGREPEVSPAMEPGLHCGLTVALYGALLIPVSPAMEPGLHCGVRASPTGLNPQGVSPMEPGLHCGVLRTISPQDRAAVSPAMEPGLHCGVGGDKAFSVEYMCLPGDGAGAPLRRLGRSQLHCQDDGSPRRASRGSIAAR